MWESRPITPADNFPRRRGRSPWKKSARPWSPKRRRGTVTNYEASQPPLYYTLAGLWWRLGKVCGFHDGFLLYWLRFLNIFSSSRSCGWALWRRDWFFRKTCFCGSAFRRCWPSFRKAPFIPFKTTCSRRCVLARRSFCLVKLLRAERAGCPAWERLTGLALAATFLTKISNLPLLAVSGLVVLFKISRLAKAGKLRAAVPGAGGAGVVRGPADDCLAGVVQARLRRFHRHGGENSISRLDAQTVRRMVASSDYGRHEFTHRTAQGQARRVAREGH
jgi:hypothetical protein